MTRKPEAAMRHDAEQEAAEKAFFAFIDGLDESTKAPRRFREILEAAEDSGDYETGLERLKRYVTERETSLLRVDVPTVQEGVEVRPEDVVTMTQEIRNRMNTKRFFLGSGNTASVHTLKTPGATNGWVCAKIITNRQRYKEGRSVMEEMGFLDRLSDLEAQGVRTPMPFFAFKTASMEGLVMEHLDACSLEHIINGQTTENIKDILPEQFDITMFFDRLRAYLSRMHERHIAHGDLHLGNIMIDRATGLPYIIDFGKARDLRTEESPRTFNRDGKAWDRAMVLSSEKQLREWMSTKGLTDKK